MEKITKKAVAVKLNRQEYRKEYSKFRGQGKPKNQASSSGPNFNTRR